MRLQNPLYFQPTQYNSPIDVLKLGPATNQHIRDQMMINSIYPKRNQYPLLKQRKKKFKTNTIPRIRKPSSTITSTQLFIFFPAGKRHRQITKISIKACVGVNEYPAIKQMWSRVITHTHIVIIFRIIARKCKRIWNGYVILAVVQTEISKAQY